MPRTGVCGEDADFDERARPLTDEAGFDVAGLDLDFAVEAMEERTGMVRAETDAEGLLEAAEVDGILAALPRLQHVEVHGLMTMAALTSAETAVRKTFAALRTLREQFRRSSTLPHSFHHLSMGMTNDFELAIEEGATLVRIGSALFAGLAADVP